MTSSSSSPSIWRENLPPPPGARKFQLVLSWSWITFMSVFFTVLFVLLFLRRHHPYLRARSINMMFLTLFGYAVSVYFATFHDIMGSSRMPCFLRNLAGMTLGFMATAPEIGRAVKLYCIDQINQASLLDVNHIMLQSYHKINLNNNNLNNNNNTNNNNNNNNSNLINRIQFLMPILNFYSRMKHRISFLIDRIIPRETRLKYMKQIISERYLTLGYFIVLGCHLIGYAILMVSMPQERTTGYCTSFLNRYTTVTFVLLYCMMILLCCIGVSHIREEFDIKKTMTICAFFGLFSAVTHILYETLPIFEGLRVYIPSNAWFMACIFLETINAAVYPLYRSFTKSNRSLAVFDNEEMSLEPARQLDRVIIQTEETLRLFKHYCELEFSSEIIQFYLAVKEFERTTNESDALNLAETIFDSYITVDSLYAINISHEAREKVVATYERVISEHLKNNINDNNNENNEDNNNNQYISDKKARNEIPNLNHRNNYDINSINHHHHHLNDNNHEEGDNNDNNENHSNIISSLSTSSSSSSIQNSFSLNNTNNRNYNLNDNSTNNFINFNNNNDNNYLSGNTHGHIPRNMFDPATKQVRCTLIDIFSRFTQSKIWEEYVANIQVEKQILANAGLLPPQYMNNLN